MVLGHRPTGLAFDPDGRAFVSEADARMAVDYRARFEKIGGSWQMTVFIAGD